MLCYRKPGSCLQAAGGTVAADLGAHVTHVVARANVEHSTQHRQDVVSALLQAADAWRRARAPLGGAHPVATHLCMPLLCWLCGAAGRPPCMPHQHSSPVRNGYPWLLGHSALI